MQLIEISKPIKRELAEFDKFFKQTLDSNNFLLDLVIKYILKQKGKKIRPILVLLSAQATGTTSRRSYIAASMIELLHTATLVHDDVVDSADERRGFLSVNAVWKNKIAVLVGDYILSQGLLIANSNNEFGFLGVTSKAVKRMSMGELMQIYKAKRLNITEEDYFKIISDKTASLISACCEIGAMSTTENSQLLADMADYGEYLGIVFQIRDDLFDYTASHKQIGKPIGNDIRERKLTLPLIYSLNNATKTKRQEIIKLIKSSQQNEANVQKVISFVKQAGGIEYSTHIAKKYSDMAKNSLSNLPASEAKNSLIQIVEFAMNREK